ncbi:MAG: monofunctional biosynthetic peptidoglycan transglycosylase [Bacteroidota bacterium]|nr:monofunctional biosynthetic peptidoglycan transglycosylase [Bacteroidota bacterium]
MNTIILKKIFRYLLFAALGFIGLSILSVIVFRFVNPPITGLMLVRNIQTDKAWLHVPARNWVDIEEMSMAMAVAVVASEDNLFFEHHGFDWKAIRDARKRNKQGKRMLGASTISQQTAKNLFLFPHRNYFRKGLEVWFTFLIELFWHKARILEVYLNIIETGPGMYGVEMAANKYFHKSAPKLTKSEAALIAACLPNPIRRKPNNPTKYIRKRQKWILWNMKNVWPVVEKGVRERARGREGERARE